MKRFFALFLSLATVLALCAACSVEESDSKEKTYSCNAIVLISQTSSENAGSHTTENFASAVYLDKTYYKFLQLDSVLAPIYEKYPDTEFDISMERIEDTERYKIIVTGENKENLRDICNMAVDRFCEVAAKFLAGVSFRIVDPATDPK